VSRSTRISDLVAEVRDVAFIKIIAVSFFLQNGIDFTAAESQKEQ